jgi:hypothetical protein
MSKFQPNTNAVVVASFPDVACEGGVCELQSSPQCEGYTRLEFVKRPEGILAVCPTCAGVV